MIWSRMCPVAHSLPTCSAQLDATGNSITAHVVSLQPAYRLICSCNLISDMGYRDNFLFILLYGMNIPNGC